MPINLEMVSLSKLTDIIRITTKSREAGFRGNPLGVRLKCWLPFYFFVFTVACSENVNVRVSGCISNADCSGTNVCIDEQCKTEEKDCIYHGVLNEVVRYRPKYNGQIHEAHLTIEDTTGVVHFCYTETIGNESSVHYGRQLDSISFSEEPVVSDKLDQISCAGIVVSNSGDVVILSSDSPAILSRKRNETVWTAFEIKELSGSEATSALKSPNTQVDLTTSDSGQVYIALSLGFELASQPIFLAVLDNGVLSVLENGWSSDGGMYSATGHSPQFLFQNDSYRVVLGQVPSKSIILLDSEMKIMDKKEGIYPRSAASSSGDSFMVYMDRNSNLNISEIRDREFFDLAQIGPVSTQFSKGGQIPWDIHADSKKNIHLLIHDSKQGENALLYRRVDVAGNSSLPIFLDSSYFSNLPGSQKMGITVDICQRPTAVFFSKSENPDVANETSGPVLVIVEGV